MSKAPELLLFVLFVALVYTVISEQFKGNTMSATVLLGIAFACLVLNYVTAKA